MSEKLSEWMKKYIYEKFDVDERHSTYSPIMTRIEALEAELNTANSVTENFRDSFRFHYDRAEKAESCLAEAEAEVKRLKEYNQSLQRTLNDGTTLLVAQNNKMNELQSRLSEAEKIAREMMKVELPSNPQANAMGVTMRICGNSILKALRGEVNGSF